MIQFILQPLFPGESGVDQLVEIIKVISFRCQCSHSVCVFTFIDDKQWKLNNADPWYTNKGGNKVHEPKLYGV